MTYRVCAHWRLALALAVVLSGVGVAASSEPTGPNRLTVQTATYLGDWDGNSASGVAVAPSGEVVVVGKLAAGRTPGNVRPVSLLGGGDGAIVRMDASGSRVLGVTRLGSDVQDVAVGDDGRVVVAADGAGVVVLQPDAAAIAWRDESARAIRVAVGGSGRVVALTTDKHVRVYDRGGRLVGSRRFGDNYVTDVAIDDASGLVFVTGFNNRRLRMRNGRRGPVQVAFIRAFDIDNLAGAARWVNYDWPGDILGATPPGEDASRYHLLEADTRGYRLAMGRDGKLYFAGESAGGNSIFNKDPRDLNRNLSGEELIRIDPHSHPYNTAANHITVYACFEPATGKVERVQWLLSRLANNRGNTIRPRGLAADEQGRVYVVGSAGHHITHRGDIWINGQRVHPEHGDGAFLLITSPDWRRRETWVVFGDGGRGVGVDVRGGKTAVANQVGRQLLTTQGALYGQGSADYQSNAHLVVLPRRTGE